MKIYEVTEYVPAFNDEENAIGYFSSLEKAQQGVLKRVKETYTEEEIKAFYIDENEHSYSVIGNDGVIGCDYAIYEHELDEEIKLKCR